MNRLRLLLCLTATVAACAQPPQARAGAAAPETNPWTALANLPDWSGVWIPDIPDQFAQMTSNPVPWTPAVAAKIDRLKEQEQKGHPKGLFANCLPEAMPSWMVISHNALEFLFTPGRVTMLGESDGNRLRRIYTDGRQHPSDPDPSFHGHSIGHWDRDALVIDTVAVMPETFIAISEAVGVPNNGGLHVVERIHLASADILADDLEIVAPRVLTRPWKTTRRFQRRRGAQFDLVEGVCLQGSFAESVDKNGDAVFVPVAQAEGGNPVPPDGDK